MKNFLHTLFLFIVCSQAFPQQYGNEWLYGKYDQQYFRIFIYGDSIYRIDSATLAAALVPAGINMTTLDPRNIQIFGRGQEQYIYIKGESDSHFNSGDYVEFYGLHNDGWYDNELYSNPADQPNPNYSMFNDTAIYYLTINNSVSNRRMTLESAINFSAYTVASYFYKVLRNDFTGSYFYGEKDYNGLTDPSYISTEGWFDSGFSLGGSIIKNIPTSNAYSPGNALIDFLLIGESNYTGITGPNHHVQINFAGVTIDTTFTGYYVKHYYTTVPTSSLSSSTTSFSFASVPDLGSGADRNTIAYIDIKYPHTLNLGNNSNDILYVPDATGQTKTYLNLSNFAATTGDSVRFYDLTNHKRIRVAKNGSNYQVLVPNGSGEKMCYITSEGQIHNVLSVIPVSYDVANYAKFTDYTSPSVLNSDYLIVTHISLWSEAESYKNYRNSFAGGGYHTLLADVNELYDQFSYGIRKNPMAIKNFARFAYDNFTDPPKYLFLIGKGYRAGEIGNINKSYRKYPYYYSQTLIPGFGAPPVDNLFTTFNNASYKPFIPTGRLAARNPAQVDLYLNKVMDYEAAQAAAQAGIVTSSPLEWEWMKNVLHFGGGSNITQQNTLAAYLNGYKNTIEGPFFGGFVRTFLKSSTAPIQQNLSDSLKILINNGVSLMTFFGHAAGIGFDMSTDYPSAYDNFKKYPFLLANSCFAGDLFNAVPTSSEEFVLIEDKGVIGYLASITKGSTGPLDRYSSFFYKNIGIINYGQSVGKCIQNTIDTLQKIYQNDFYIKSTCLEMTLHGDPAIKINSFAKPDYVATQPGVYFTPANVTTLDSLFTINIISTNIGKALDTSFIVNVHRRFPDGSEVDSFRMVNATLYKDTISFNLPVDFVRGVGLNIFTVSLDYYPSHIDEISENNNTVTVNLYIKSNDITPVYPYRYAIVPSLNLTLKASTGDPFAPARNYIFQVDTTDAFTNPLISQVVNHSGGVVTFTPTLPIITDSIVYFWRVSVDSTINNGYNWRESSFQYINGKRGWGQAHFFQFKNDTYQYVHYNKPIRKFEFFNDIKSLQAQTGYYTNDY
ncbi:MAG: C25 family cysteine peptidase, partial [Bacteroidales bacterium]